MTIWWRRGEVGGRWKWKKGWPGGADQRFGLGGHLLPLDWSEGWYCSGGKTIWTATAQIRSPVTFVRGKRLKMSDHWMCECEQTEGAWIESHHSYFRTEAFKNKKKKKMIGIKIDFPSGSAFSLFPSLHGEHWISRWLCPLYGRRVKPFYCAVLKQPIITLD